MFSSFYPIYPAPSVNHCLNLCIDKMIRSHVATEENVQEAIRLFTVSTMDAARSGIHQQVNLTPEMANEIKVCLVLQPKFGISFPRSFTSYSNFL